MENDDTQRLPYVRPEQRTYGAITRLVQGMSGLGLEGLSGMSQPMV